MKNIFWICLFISQNIFAQYTPCYYYWANKAEVAFEVDKDCEKAIDLYQKAFKTVKKEQILSPHLRGIAKAYACLNLTNKSLRYLKKAIETGYEWRFLKRSKAFVGLKSMKGWQKLAQQYPRLRKTYENTLNLELYTTITNLYAREQYVRKIFMKDRENEVLI